MADPQDRRKRALVLTGEGQRAHTVAKEIIDGFTARSLGDMPAEETRTVIEPLDEMRAKTQPP
ncbi:hypothetical protein ACWD4G_34785 [Streptomyces sp. NPDC002643]